MHQALESARPVLGLPSWLVRKGHGSFLTLEFGEPRVEVGEPRSKPVFLVGGPTHALTRDAFVKGQWHLWIYCCIWSVFLDGLAIADSESDDATIARALRVLNGQALADIEVSPTDVRCKFTFDLGCVVETRPAAAGTYADEPVEQWMLFQPSGNVFVLRGDGRYFMGPATGERAEQVWHKITPGQ